MRRRKGRPGKIELIAAGFCVLTGSILAGEPTAMSGEVQLEASRGFFSQAFLMKHGAGEVVAGLLDPLGVLRSGDAILQIEVSGKLEVDGAPLVEVREVLPQFWAQPASHGHFVKGPGAFSGYGRERQAKDFAGVPLESRRAYHDDNGFERVMVAGTSGTLEPVPLRVSETRADGDTIFMRWGGHSGLVYRLLRGDSVDGEFEVVEEFRAAEGEILELTTPILSDRAFYILQAVQP